MPRAALPIGAWGAIVSKKNAKTGKWRASCRFKDMDGVTRVYSKHAATKGKAENALLAAMKERQDQGRQPVENISFGEVARRWLSSIEPAKVVVDERGEETWESPRGRIRRQTWDQYEAVMRRYLIPGLGALPIRSIRTSTCDAFLRSLTVDGKGSSNVRIGKTILRQIMSYAIRHDLYVDANPVLEVDRLSRNAKKPQALDMPALEAIRAAVRNWRSEPGVPGPAPTSALSDVVDVMLGTGARIGEVLALRWQDVDLSGEVGKVSITGTIVEPRKGPKFRQDATKTASGARIIPIPRFVVDVLLRRRLESPATNTIGAVFWTRNGTYMQAWDC